MTPGPNSNMRKWLALAAAIALYYLVHEGAHCLAAGMFGAFVGVRWLGPGVQTVVNESLLSDLQLAVFCLAGSLATLTVGYLLYWQTSRICRLKSKLIKAVGYYGTIVLLLADPLYLAVLYKCFGGGDMNGIILFGCPELLIQLVYLLIGLVNMVLIKRIYPMYKRAFI